MLNVEVKMLILPTLLAKLKVIILLKIPVSQTFTSERLAYEIFGTF